MNIGNRNGENLGTRINFQIKTETPSAAKSGRVQLENTNKYTLDIDYVLEQLQSGNLEVLKELQLYGIPYSCKQEHGKYTVAFTFDGQSYEVTGKLDISSATEASESSTADDGVDARLEKIKKEIISLLQSYGYTEEVINEIINKCFGPESAVANMEVNYSSDEELDGIERGLRKTIIQTLVTELALRSNSEVKNTGIYESLKDVIENFKDTANNKPAKKYKNGTSTYLTSNYSTAKGWVKNIAASFKSAVEGYISKKNINIPYQTLNDNALNAAYAHILSYNDNGTSYYMFSLNDVINSYFMCIESQINGDYESDVDGVEETDSPIPSQEGGTFYEEMISFANELNAKYQSVFTNEELTAIVDSLVKKYPGNKVNVKLELIDEFIKHFAAISHADVTQDNGLYDSLKDTLSGVQYNSYRTYDKGSIMYLTSQQKAQDAIKTIIESKTKNQTTSLKDKVLEYANGKFNNSISVSEFNIMYNNALEAAYSRIISDGGNIFKFSITDVIDTFLSELNKEMEEYSSKFEEENAEAEATINNYKSGDASTRDRILDNFSYSLINLLKSIGYHYSTESKANTLERGINNFIAIFEQIIKDYAYMGKDLTDAELKSLISEAEEYIKHNINKPGEELFKGLKTYLYSINNLDNELKEHIKDTVCKQFIQEIDSPDIDVEKYKSKIFTYIYDNLAKQFVETYTGDNLAEDLMAYLKQQMYTVPRDVLAPDIDNLNSAISGIDLDMATDSDFNKIKNSANTFFDAMVNAGITKIKYNSVTYDITSESSRKKFFGKFDRASVDKLVAALKNIINSIDYTDKLHELCNADQTTVDDANENPTVETTGAVETKKTNKSKALDGALQDRMIAYFMESTYGDFVLEMQEKGVPGDRFRLSTITKNEDGSYNAGNVTSIICENIQDQVFFFLEEFCESYSLNKFYTENDGEAKLENLALNAINKLANTGKSYSLTEIWTQVWNDLIQELPNWGLEFKNN